MRAWSGGNPTGRIVRSVRIDDTPVLIGPLPAPDEAETSAQNAQAPAHACETARQEAEALLNQAKEEAAQIRRLAYNEGYNAGLAQGKAEAEAQARIHLQAIRATLADLQALKTKILADAEPQLVNLALAIAESVLHHTVEINPRVVTYILKAAIQKVHARDILRIAVNPRDHETILRYWSEFHDPEFRQHGLEIVADDEVSPGGVVVHTSFGRIDGRIEVQLEEIEEAFRRWQERQQTDQ
jgi:flagellar assembly protein FliH